MGTGRAAAYLTVLASAALCCCALGAVLAVLPYQAPLLVSRLLVGAAEALMSAAMLWR